MNMAMDEAGNIYYADFAKIYKRDTNGVTTTIGGIGTFGFSGDGSPATEAQFNVISSICLDSSGNLYLSDYDNHRIRKIDTNGIISTIAGTGEPNVCGADLSEGPALSVNIYHPTGVAADSFGNVYISQERCGLEGNKRETLYEYIGNNLHKITDPDEQVTEFSVYDDLGRIKTVLRPDNTIVKFDYDKNGNTTVTTTHTYPTDINHEFGYNGVNQQSSYSTPESGSYAYRYDTEQRLTEVYFPSDTISPIFVYDYTDPLDPNDKSLLRGIQTPEGNIQYEYSTCGVQLESITKGSEIITYEYDGIISTSEIITGTLNESLTYIYNNDTIDKDFRMDGFTYAGETELYTYDDDGLLTAIGDFTIS